MRVEGDPAVLESGVTRAFEEVAHVHHLMNVHDPSSELSTLNRRAHQEAIRVSPELWEVLTAACDLARASDGAFNPVRPPEPTDTGDRWPRDFGSWEDVQLREDRRVVFRRPLVLDLSGVAKGYAVDRAIASLRKTGIESGVVNAGGDLRVFGERRETVCVRDPRCPGRLLDLTEISNVAACTSAPYFSETPPLRSAGRRSHLWTGTSPESIVGAVSVTVVAPTAMWADALTKVVLVQRELAASLLAANGAEAWCLSAGE